ncbi:MAG: Rrf2 family transcriptional regulator [Eubacteriales bacterium]|nr:Rrf2 family transcriptional regulator [Eubacteriales bacterium]
MRISTRGRYALKLMLDLATYDNGEPIKIKDIAKRQNISEKYLEQIVSVLNKASFVKSIRGARGGYLLYDVPQHYTVGQILKVTEGSMSPVDCVGENGSPCANKDTCVSVRIWEKLDDAINEVLEGITLADLLEWQNELLVDQYVI